MTETLEDCILNPESGTLNRSSESKTMSHAGGWSAQDHSVTINISTRRFRALPSGVLLGAMGFASP